MFNIKRMFRSSPSTTNYSDGNESESSCKLEQKRPRPLVPTGTIISPVNEGVKNISKQVNNSNWKVAKPVPNLIAGSAAVLQIPQWTHISGDNTQFAQPQQKQLSKQTKPKEKGDGIATLAEVFE